MNWAVGVVTAPRKQGYYLDRTLESLTRAGFGGPIVFAEPGSFVPEGHTVVRRPKQYGDWANWATGLYELLLSEPTADYYFMVEDDGLFCKGMREYLERTLPTLGEFASVSPYTPGRYHIHNFTGYHNQCHGALTWSTLTVIMPRKSVIGFFSDPDVQRHRFEDIFAGKGILWGFTVDPKNSAKDAVIGQWAEKNGLPMYYHTPCLASHVGVNSTLSDKQTTWENMAVDFVGEDFVPDWQEVRVRKSQRVLL